MEINCNGIESSNLTELRSSLNPLYEGRIEDEGSYASEL